MRIDGDLDRPRRGPRIFRRRQLPPGLAVAAALLLASCHLMGVPRTGPEGRSMHDTDLQRLIREEAFIEALDLTDPDDRGEIGDELLRLMHRGLLLHYAGRYAESNEVLQRAEEIIDDRYTKSVSVALLSLVTNDRALAWIPGDTERMMVNYYGALNYLALANPEEAAVEARRLSRLLELGEDDELDAAEIEMRKTLRYFAASVFEASGDHNNAAVAYRHVWSPADAITDTPLRPRFIDLYGVDIPDQEPPEAARDFDTVVDSLMAAISADSIRPVGPDSLVVSDSLNLPDGLAAPDGLATPDVLSVSDSLFEPPGQVAGSGGDVVILLEHGFVAHRVERSLNVPVFPKEADALHDSNSDVRFAAASCVASRALKDRYDFTAILSESGTDWRNDLGGQCDASGANQSGRASDDLEDLERQLYLMRVAWPEMISSGLPTDLPVLGLSIAADARPLQVASLDATPGAAPMGAPGDPEAGLLPAADGAADGPQGPPLILARPAMRGSVSGAVTEEFEDQLGGIMIKMVARTALKYELARGIEKELDKKDETLGDIAFFTANAAAALFERADTRSWHLLPDEVSVVRLRLPAGIHPLSLEVETGRGEGTRLIDLGEVVVWDGSVQVLSARVWP
jgi:hypothetical protein